VRPSPARLVLVALVAAGPVAAGPGCATIFSGTRQRVTFRSTPPARVFVDGREVGTTELSVPIPRQPGAHVRFHAEGHADATVVLHGHPNPVTLLNLPLFLLGILPGIVGFAVDLITGAFWDLSPDDVFVTLDPPRGAPR